MLKSFALSTLLSPLLSSLLSPLPGACAEALLVAAGAAAAAGQAEVSYIQPDKFSDAGRSPSEREAVQQKLLNASLLVLLAIFLVLHVSLRDWRLAGLIFLALPAALVGAMLAAFAGDRVISLGSLVGIITVGGIAARNGILLFQHFRHLEAVEREPFGIGLVLRGASERLSPIVMTSLCTAVALLPLIVPGSIPGHEIEHPMAVVILGGLVTSTLLSLFVLPVLYLRIAQAAHPAEAAAGGPPQPQPSWNLRQ